MKAVTTAGRAHWSPRSRRSIRHLGSMTFYFEERPRQTLLLMYALSPSQLPQRPPPMCARRVYTDISRRRRRRLRQHRVVKTSVLCLCRVQMTSDAASRAALTFVVCLLSKRRVRDRVRQTILIHNGIGSVCLNGGLLHVSAEAFGATQLTLAKTMTEYVTNKVGISGARRRPLHFNQHSASVTKSRRRALNLHPPSSGPCTIIVLFIITLSRSLSRRCHATVFTRVSGADMASESAMC